jgi:hypothetical protein
MRFGKRLAQRLGPDLFARSADRSDAAARRGRNRRLVGRVSRVEHYEGAPMPSQHDLDRSNDVRFLTPILLMAVIMVCGILIYVYVGHALAAAG